MRHQFLTFGGTVAALSLAIAGCSGNEAGGDKGTARQADAGSGIATVKAKAVDAVPLGEVPGQVSLPPEARVAVTSPFPGAAVRVFVIEGQVVRRGQPLALVRAAEPVQIRGDLARAQAELGLAEARAQRLRQLAKEGIIAQARSDEADAALAQARASATQANRMSSLAGAGPDGTMTLRAPISGRISHVAIETGGGVDGMTAPFVIENAGAYRIDLQLPARLAKSVRPGMAVEVHVPGTDGVTVKVGGKVLSVAPSLDPETRSVMAKASIGAAPGLVPGQNVMVAISGASGDPGIAIPSAAVTRIDGSDHVFVKGPRGFVPRKVEIAADSGEQAIAASGLAAGETVAVKGIAELKAMAAE